MTAQGKTLFGTSGIRGPAATLFTPQFCFDIGRTFARFLDERDQKGPLGFGIDSRQSSPHIAQNVIYGLKYAGREVKFMGVIPVPAALYSLISTNLTASIMTTGSHIDASSNGLKFFCFREEISKDQEQEISDIYYQIKEQVAPKPYYGAIDNFPQGTNNYIEMLLSLVDGPLPKFKIVFDPGNGGQTEIIRTVLHELGQEVISLNDNIQEPLISRDTEQDGAFQTLQDAVKSHHADLGIGFDSDGDRAVFVDHQGNFVPGDYSGTLLAQWHAGNTLAVNINVSNVVNSIHKEVIRTKVGSPYVIAAMKKYGANFGFESNGGIIHEDVMLTRDGGASFIKMLNVLKWSKKNLKELVESLPRYYIRRSKFPCQPENYEKILTQSKHFLHPQSIDETDGVKLIMDADTWVLFRPSGNAPEFRVFVESKSQTKANQLLDQALSFAQGLI